MAMSGRIRSLLCSGLRLSRAGGRRVRIVCGFGGLLKCQRASSGEVCQTCPLRRVFDSNTVFLYSLFDDLQDKS